MNRLTIKVLICFVAFFSCVGFSSAQDSSYDVFKPIAKYLSKGDVESLSVWFSNNMEVTIFSSTNTTSRSQAMQIVKSFFSSYTPRSFDITHKAGRPNMKYALGTLAAGGELFLVTIFVSMKDADYKIQQLKIERLN